MNQTKNGRRPGQGNGAMEAANGFADIVNHNIERALLTVTGLLAVGCCLWAFHAEPLAWWGCYGGVLVGWGASGRSMP